jgi:hypothetical protein
MFCALKGATLKPWFKKKRQSAVATTLFPTSDPVPKTAIHGALVVDFKLYPAKRYILVEENLQSQFTTNSHYHILQPTSNSFGSFG